MARHVIKAPAFVEWFEFRDCGSLPISHSGKAREHAGQLALKDPYPFLSVIRCRLTSIHEVMATL